MAELLAVPFKKSSDVDIVKPLKNLIQSTYNTEEYSDALTELSRLRSNAIWKIFEKSNLEYLNSYYDQLVSLESKLPPQEVQIPFKWKDAFDKGSIFGGRMSLTLSSLSYERVCILFNMAAAQSALASSQPLDNEESLKLAAKLLQQAAGIFSHLKETVLLALHGEPTPDLAPDTLAALAALMLAQAQEVIAYKCIQDEMKPSMAARVCAGAADLYGDALRALQRDSLRPLWDRDWIPTVTTKQQILSGLAQYFQAAVCQAGGAPGQEIARLTLALKLMPQAKDHPRLQDIYRRCGARLASAQKDNDFIYHERVPEASQLEAIKGAAVAKPLPVQDKYCTGVKDLFEGLAPAAVHRALAASEARKSDAVNAEINKLRDATQLLNSVLASLNLPACVETVAPGSLPASIRGKAAAVRGAGGAGGLRARQAELPALLARNTELLDEAERMLREEEEADNALRAQFGARWTRTASAQLTATFRANADKYRQIIDNAVRADKIVEEKYNQHKESISLLSGSDSELEAGVPRAGGPRADCAALSTLRKLMDDVETLKAERDAIECELKSVTLDMKQQFLTALAASGALDEPALTAAALAAPLTPLRQQVQETVARQEELLVKIQEAHKALMEAQGGASGRDAALARLCAAHDAYQEIDNNLKEGIKFYNDLTQLLVAFQNKVSDFCFARRTEKEELLKDLTQDASRAPARAAPEPPAHHGQVEEPAVIKREAPPRPPPPSAGGSSAPAAAPAPAAAASLPYPQQPQGMPLPYAMAAAPYPYYAAPMPVSYNPYATLPYPHHARAPPAPQYQPYQYPPPQPGYQPPPGGYNPYGPQQ